MIDPEPVQTLLMLCTNPGHIHDYVSGIDCLSSHSDKKIRTNKPMNKTGAGYSRRNLKLKLARALMADLESTEDKQTRLEQARLIKALIEGRTTKAKDKPSVFG